MRIIMPVDLEIEPKEDETGEGVQPGIPSESELASYLRDLLADTTKRDERIGYRILRVDTAT
jgi:hypothetical protein